MCGIVGAVGKVQVEFIKDACSSIQHRGPDDSGYYVDGNVSLGQTRLSIIDLSQNGHQPMISEDGNLVLIYNGEIYNHNDIRKELLQRAYSFKSTSDTETLLYGYKEFGPGIVNKLNGIFAFAVYDKAKQELFIARDHFGVKPLYYFSKDDIFSFSSELKAFRTLKIFDKSVSPEAFFNYLQLMYCPGEQTPFKFVKKLLPGHWLKLNITSGKFTIEKYYDVSYGTIENNRSETEWVNELEQKLLDAIRSQLMSDVPVGYFLSGGLDSSLIVAMAGKLLPNTKLDCFTVSSGAGYKQEGFSDDLSYARKVARHLGANLCEVDGGLDILNKFDEMIWHLDEPQADPAPLHVYNICKGAKEKNIKVLLGGTAGDDIFSGYRRHQAVKLENIIRYFPKSAAKLLKLSISALPVYHPALRRLRKLSQDIQESKSQRLVGYFNWLPSKEVLSLFNSDVRLDLNNKLMPQAYFLHALSSLPKSTHDLNKLLYLELKGFLPDHNLNYTDKMSMSLGVETRVPYLDLPLVQFASSMPPSLKLKGNTTKYVLRKVAERYLPKEVIYRPKTGFGAPVRHWIKYEMRDLLHQRLTGNLEKWNLFDLKEIRRLIAANESGKVDASHTIWALLSIDSWLQQFVENN